jgi:hypothetical protein
VGRECAGGGGEGLAAEFDVAEVEEEEGREGEGGEEEEHLVDGEKGEESWVRTILYTYSVNVEKGMGVQSGWGSGFMYLRMGLRFEMPVVNVVFIADI